MRLTETIYFKSIIPARRDFERQRAVSDIRRGSFLRITSEIILDKLPERVSVPREKSSMPAQSETSHDGFVIEPRWTMLSEKLIPLYYILEWTIGLHGVERGLLFSDPNIHWVKPSLSYKNSSYCTRSSHSSWKTFLPSSYLVPTPWQMLEWGDRLD